MKYLFTDSMSSETPHSVLAAGWVEPLKAGAQAAGWAAYFGKGDPLNRAGKVLNGQQEQDNADITAVIETLRLLRKKHHTGTNFRILTDNEKVVEAAKASSAEGHGRILLDELALVEKAGYTVVVDKLLGDERSKNFDEAVSMAQHEAQTLRN